MEDSLDECIDDRLRKLDQMCFSSQYYTMLTVQFNGIMFIVMAHEIWFRTNVQVTIVPYTLILK